MSSQRTVHVTEKREFRALGGRGDVMLRDGLVLVTVPVVEAVGGVVVLIQTREVVKEGCELNKVGYGDVKDFGTGCVAVDVVDIVGH